ncbi:lantibiotic dehydratase [Longispora sp. K20-0274]|uniref:thioesterase domain-containing protein n=1 Tax=Longispora sp. K20-0274 TaxID=3088255 RepID=UPI003999D159
MTGPSNGDHSRTLAAPTRPEADALLFCLPYAGGGASVFLPWRAAFGASVDVQPVQLPGRENRIAEPAHFTPEEVAAAIADRADRPYAIYGHSMGARLGFEVIRHLRRTGARLPVRFYVGGSLPPDLEEAIVRIADLPDDGFVRGLEELGGTPPGALDVPELRELLLPLLRADFAWIDGYRFTDEPPLPVPIVGFAGDADRSTPPDLMAGWERHTSAGFAPHTVPGGHFFLHGAMDRVVDVISADLLAAVSATPAVPTDAVAVEPAPRPELPAATHRVPLPGTDWTVWRHALLRTTGFPADGLNRLSSADLAQAADAHLDGLVDADGYAKAYEEAAARISAEVWAIATDPLFREAVTWQNRNALFALDGIAKQGPVAARNSKRRQREEMVAQYWQRYCSKNETVGFFGPTSWIDLDPQGPAVTVSPGPGLVRERRVFFEHWALSAFAAAVTADPRARQWLVPSISPQLLLDGRHLVRVAQAPLALSPAEAVLLAECDGRRPAIEVARAAAGAQGSPLRTPEDALILLGLLAERALVRWDLDMPMRMNAEDVLAERLAAIREPDLREHALAGLARLRADRDAIEAAGGDPVAVQAALTALNETFVELTGQEAERRAGQMYAGRTLVVEECVRDLDAGIGGAVLEAMAGPFEVLLQAARWLTVATGEAYLAVLGDFYQELARDLGTPDVPFGQLWYLAQGIFFGRGDRPVDDVAEEFTRRWTDLFRLDRFGDDTKAVALTSAELADLVREVFPADRPAWAAARVHSPDLHVCATSVDALARGEFSLVLGEIHAAWATLDAGLFLVGCTQVEELRAATLADVGPGRVLPLYPLDWPRYTARLSGALDNDTDFQLGILPGPGADPDRLIPVTALTVSERDGELVVHGRGQSWPLIEMFAELIGIHTQGAFKLVAATGHTPRVTVDRMVLARETWRTTIGDTGLADVRGEQAQYLAVRRWRAASGLPETVFVSIATETKPCYVDLSSPVYATIFCSMLRAARLSHGDDVRVTITEMLPTPDEAWVPDADGNRYFSEIRVQVCDPVPASTGRSA